MTSNRLATLALIAVGAAILVASLVMPPSRATVWRSRPEDLRPNPSPEIRAIIARATSAQIRRVHAPRSFRLWNDLGKDGLLPESLLGPPIALSQMEFAELQQSMQDPESVWDAGGPKKACLFHPDVQIEFSESADAASMTIIVCMRCWDWRYHGSGEADLLPAPNAHAVVRSLAASHFPDDEDLKQYLP